MCTHTTYVAGRGREDHAHSHYTRCGEGEGEGESYTCCGGRVVWELLVNIPNCLNQPARGRDERLLVCLFACLFVYHTWTTPCAPGSPLCWPLLPCPYLDLLTVPPDIKKTPVKRHILINMLFTLASVSALLSVPVCLCVCQTSRDVLPCPRFPWTRRVRPDTSDVAHTAAPRRDVTFHQAWLLRW